MQRLYFRGATGCNSDTWSLKSIACIKQLCRAYDMLLTEILLTADAEVMDILQLTEHGHRMTILTNEQSRTPMPPAKMTSTLWAPHLWPTEHPKGPLARIRGSFPSASSLTNACTRKEYGGQTTLLVSTQPTAAKNVLLLLMRGSCLPCASSLTTASSRHKHYSR